MKSSHPIVRETSQITTGPVEKHQFWPAASFTKPGNDTNRQPANWTFSTGPTVFQATDERLPAQAANEAEVTLRW